MSIEALNWAKKYRTGSATKKAILMVLADYADEAWSCFPSQATIAEQAEVSDRTVRTILKEWEDEGLIRREHRGRQGGTGRSSDRIYLQPNGVTDCRPEPQPEAASGNASDLNRKLTTPQPEICDTSTGSLASDEPPENQKKEPPTHTRVSFDEFWAAWKDKRGKGQAKRAFDSAAKKGLLPPKEDLIAAVENYFASDKPQRGYVKNASNWLRDEDWEAEYEPTPELVGQQEEDELEALQLRAYELIGDGCDEDLKIRLYNAMCSRTGLKALLDGVPV